MSDAPFQDPLLDPLFTTAEAAAVFSPRQRLQGLLDFEAALARAEARVGVIPAAAAAAIGAACDAKHYDLAELGAAAALAGNIAIPLVKQLTRRVAAADAEAARYVHWGATSQDAIDSGLMLQLRRYAALLDADLARLAAALALLADRHRGTVMVGRTWLQQALPISFGLKSAVWLDALQRDRERLRAAQGRFALQFGGAAGTLASLGAQAMPVAQALAEELELPLPALPWHASRDRILEFAAALGLLAGSLGKLGRDLSLLMQTELGEALEPAAPGRGGSSTMPHKRNPVACAVLLAAAVRVPGLVAGLLAGAVQEHERGLGGWHAEWQALPELCRLAAGAARQAAATMEQLEIKPDQMRQNLELTDGLIMAEAVSLALGERMGRLQAHERVAAASRQAIAEGRPLRAVLEADPAVLAVLDAAALARLFDPAGYLGAAGAFIDRVLAAQPAA